MLGAVQTQNIKPVSAPKSSQSRGPNWKLRSHENPSPTVGTLHFRNLTLISFRLCIAAQMKWDSWEFCSVPSPLQVNVSLGMGFGEKLAV